MNNTLFIGLGRMGRPMSSHIAKRFSTSVYDVLKKSVDDAAEESGAEPIYDLKEAAGIDTVILMLPTSAHVESILLEEGLLGRLSAGALIIDMGSSVPASTRQLAEAAAKLGIDYVDAPVSGGISKAATGELTMLVGGEPDAIGRARPFLQTVGSEIVVVGSSGAGHAAKAINNLVSATNIAVVSEAVLRGKSAGIAPERMVEVLNASTGMSQASRVKFVQHILPGSYASNFAYDLMLKDMGIAMQINAPDAASPLTREAYRLLSDGRDVLGDNPDHTEIARVYEHLAGTSISEEEA
ncbi:3-hydroxyisobutyrate dehydrogenase [Paramicrobacterium humi]|uniref:3-hydroxyisobutyrate dehydrogenase n=1 Tax=Paramicrobacterium humi TaxID=640635 RepID=A0A1H4KSP6_9MICO|nr:NAD(P)-dependent oxidoreductase [Microbacterium humi]SEB61413.1 3-hydroxyisobutyrate dehydrogenase [Microbacterium humi]